MLILPINGTVAKTERSSHFISCKSQFLPPIFDICKIELAHYITSSQLSILEIDYVYNTLSKTESQGLFFYFRNFFFLLQKDIV